MKLTKYAQSCLMLELSDVKILVDPGNIDFDYPTLEEWNKANVILITHKHADHCHAEIIKKLIENGATLFSTREVQLAYPEIKVHIIKEGDVLMFKSAKIEVAKAVHGYNPALKSREAHEAVGYIIHNAGKRIYITGDTIGFPNDYKCDILCLPINGHGLVFGPADAAMFAKETGAGLIIPTHYDNPRWPADIEAVKREFEKQGINYKILEKKESIEL